MVCNSIVGKIFNVIGWLFLGIFLIPIIAMMLGVEAEANTEYAFIIFSISSLVAYLFTRMRIQYCLSCDSFSRTVTPAAVFGRFNRCVNFKEKKFKYIFITRSSASTRETGYSPKPKFYIEITHQKQSGLIVDRWQDLVSLFEFCNSDSAAAVYEFALQVRQLTGLEVVVDPEWRDLVKAEVPEISG